MSLNVMLSGLDSSICGLPLKCQESRERSCQYKKLTRPKFFLKENAKFIMHYDFMFLLKVKNIQT